MAQGCRLSPTEFHNNTMRQAVIAQFNFIVMNRQSTILSSILCDVCIIVRFVFRCFCLTDMQKVI